MKKLTLTMPQPGETITQGTLVKWLVKPGSMVKEKEPIAELETEKAVFEYESPFEGKLLEQLIKAQDTVPVGAPIALFEVEDEKAKNYKMLGLGEEEKKPELKSESSAHPVIKKSEVFSKGSSLPLSPLVRSLLREHNLDESVVAEIQGTRPGERITKEDILRYLGTKREGDEVIPCSPVRLRIAENMVLSKRTIPHAHTSVTVDFTSMVDYRKGIKEKRPGYLSLIFPALKDAITKFPMVNASFRDLGGQKAIVLHKTLNLGVAVDTPRGLYIPVIPRANEKDSETIEKELEQLLDRAQKNKLKPQDLVGMTFTFNNHGYYGTNIGVQIILSPQSTTLGMGKIEQRPWVVDGQVQIRWISELTMAFDHRVMDGRDAGQFLNALKNSLEKFTKS